MTGPANLAYQTLPALLVSHRSFLMQSGHCTVVVDVNWRPVFWGDEAVAKGQVAALAKDRFLATMSVCTCVFVLFFQCPSGVGAVGKGVWFGLS